jgi:ABC-type Fe3+-hydroxamate transport system substrate-binding protein
VEGLRIVSLAPALTETIVELGAGDELVGVSVYCRDYAPDKPVAGTYISANWRVLKQLQPDVIVLQEYVQEKLYRELRERGFRAYILPLPSSLHGIADNAALLGGIIGRRAEGLELAAKIAERVVELEKSRPMRTVRGYVEYVWPDYQTRMSPGALSFADHAVRLAGVENIYSQEPRMFVEPDPRRVVEAEPTVVIVSAEKLMRLTRERYLEKTPWARNLRAVREGRLVILPGGKGEDLAHPGPSLLDTVEKLRARLASLLSS